MADNTYIIQEKDNKWSEMEIQKKAEGKWTVTCRTNENKTFKSLGDAVTHVVATLTKEVYKEKIDKARKAKKYREELKKHPVTPAETLKKAAETVENKIKKNRSRAVIMAAIKETKKILKGLYEELKEAKE
jgi:superfamily I DNA and RNA helicase